MNWQECYKWGQENCGLGVGDKVKVLRKAKNGEMGWENNWISPEMDRQIGGVFEIINLIKGGISLSPDAHRFPFFVLELVEKAKEQTTIPPDVMEIIDNNYFGCSREAVIKLVDKIFEKINKND